MAIDKILLKIEIKSSLSNECIFSKIKNTPNSTTFKDVDSKDHPLYNCLNCSGYDFNCKNYKPASKYIKNEIVYIAIIPEYFLKNDLPRKLNLRYSHT